MGDLPKPKICQDKLGCRFAVVVCGPDDLAALLDMYECFFPEPVAQGLPPRPKTVLERWLIDLLSAGVNFLAFQEGKVIGHAALLLETDSRDGEYLIFVGGPFRKRGIATELTRCAMEMAGQVGLRSIWLTVEVDNFRAVRLYKKFGFKFCTRGCGERKMLMSFPNCLPPTNLL